MNNLRMEEKIACGEAIDVSEFPREGNFYVLSHVIEGMDYCDASSEHWVWSIGRRISDGKILASLTPCFYGNKDYDCLWLR